MMDTAKLFPCGSVVLLDGADKELMIIGILPVNDNERYDYMAVMYPEGYISENHIFLFNHDDIREVKFLGYMDSNYQVFRTGLNIALQDEGLDEK